MKVLIITLQRKVERRLNAFYLASSLTDQGFEVEEFPATDFTSPDFRDIKIAPAHEANCQMTAGELACAWSHIRAYQAILESGEPAFIVEDDAHLSAPLADVDISEVPHFLSLSCYDSSDPNQELFETLEEGETDSQVLGLPHGTQCYYVTPEGAEALLGLLVPVKWPSDIALSRASQKGVIVTQLIKEPLAVQHPVIESHIGQR